MLLTTRLRPRCLRSGGFLLAHNRPLRALAARRRPLRCGSLLRSRRRWRRRKSLRRLRRFALLRSASAFGQVFALTVPSVAPTLVFGLVGLYPALPLMPAGVQNIKFCPIAYAIKQNFYFVQFALM